MKISAQTMAAVSGLLDQVLELPVAEREPWLQKLGESQPEMVPVLREMLAAREQSGFSEVLQTPPRIGGSATATVATSALHPGERVGPYLLKRQLGAGGMAVVWLAQRADGAFKRDVALKLPMLSRLRRDLEDRFERERDILASLEHPNIARLYDAGVAEDGLPYLAMEYVEGQPITAWCDSHRYGIRERLKLFLQVLDAVQYAHARQVIHRDLKPSNILVTESGQVRLLDFGIAKLLIEGETAEETQLTQLYGRAFTVDYASPEQLRGESLNAASDIYALGVLLYELLTGNRPYQLKGATVALIEQAIVNAEIARPSTHVGQEAAANRSTTTVKLTRRLKGDLDAIVLKALAKASNDRYPSAEALADDLQRYLTGEPVEAQPDRLTYRIKKYVLRNRIGTVTAATAMFSIAALLGLAMTRLHTTTQVGLPAGSARVSDRSIAVLPFVDMSEKKDQEYFSDGLSEEVLNLLSRVPELHVPARTSSFYFKGKQSTIAEISNALGVAHVLEGSVRKAGDTVRITAQLVRADNGYHVWSQTYDRKLDDIFKVQDEIADAVVKALKVSLLSGTMPKAAATGNIEAYTLYLQARSIWVRMSTPQDFDKMADYLQQAIKLDPTFAPAWAFLSIARSNQAYFESGPSPRTWEEARRAAKQAIALDPKLPVAHTSMAFVQIEHDWDWAGAQAQVQQALELDPNSWFALLWAGRLAKAMGHMDEAREFFQRAVVNDPLNFLGYQELSWVGYWSGRLTEAQAALRKSLDLNPAQPGGHYLGGAILLESGDPAAALAEFERGSDLLRQFGRAVAYHALGRNAEANSVLAEMETKYSSREAYLIAQIHAFRGEVDLAFAWLDRAYRQHDSACILLQADPMLKNLKSDPRYKTFLRKMKFPE